MGAVSGISSHDYWRQAGCISRPKVSALLLALWPFSERRISEPGPATKDPYFSSISGLTAVDSDEYSVSQWEIVVNNGEHKPGQRIMESPCPFGGARSRGVRPHTNTPWVAANPPPSSFGDYPAHPWAGCFFQTPGPPGEFSAI